MHRIYAIALLAIAGVSDGYSEGFRNIGKKMDDPLVSDVKVELCSTGIDSKEELIELVTSWYELLDFESTCERAAVEQLVERLDESFTMHDRTALVARRSIKSVEDFIVWYEDIETAVKYHKTQLDSPIVATKVGNNSLRLVWVAKYPLGF